ncbi:MAG: hypothetical protein WCG81_22040 [Candidatus Angelobacter sp.]
MKIYLLGGRESLPVALFNAAHRSEQMAIRAFAALSDLDRSGIEFKTENEHLN